MVSWVTGATGGRSGGWSVYYRRRDKPGMGPGTVVTRSTGERTLRRP